MVCSLKKKLKKKPRPKIYNFLSNMYYWMTKKFFKNQKKKVKENIKIYLIKN
jgi:hypothetical protein